MSPVTISHSITAVESINPIQKNSIKSAYLMRRLRSYAVQSPCLGCGDGIQGLGSPEYSTGVSMLSTPYVLPYIGLYGDTEQYDTVYCSRRRDDVNVAHMLYIRKEFHAIQ